MLPKVLQLGKFYPPDIGGIESVMQDICDGINARGLVCDVLCSNSSYNFSYEILESRARIYRTKSFGKLASTSITPQMIFTLQKLIKAYDIIHLHLPDPMANLALFLSDIQGKLIILHWHSDIIKQRHLLKLYAPLQSWLLQRAHSIIATSPKYALESAFLQPYRDKCVSIPIGIDDIAPSSLESTLPQRPAQSKKGEKKVIFALGRLVAYKGFEYAIEAMTLLPQYCLHIGGTGALQQKLQQKINALGLQDRVKLLGTLSHQERAQQFRNAHIFILPSITKNEAFGIVQVEAMSQGLPVVSCSIDGSGVDYVNAHNISGLVVPPQNPAAIAQAIGEIERDYERFSRDARARFLQLFTSEKMLDSIYELYCSLYASRENLLGGGAAALGYRIYAFVDSSTAFFLSLQAWLGDDSSFGHCELCEAIHKDKLDSSVDCHADKSARNDGKTRNPNESAQDSRSFNKNAQNLTTPQAEAKVDSRSEAQNLNESAQDSRILDEKCGLQGKSQGSYLDGDLWDFSPLPHFSLKAESSKKAESLLKVAYAA